MGEEDLDFNTGALSATASAAMTAAAAKMKAGSFATMGLDQNLFQGLTRMQYKTPTPVQRKALPIVLAGMDAVCMARTGSGKTAVFLIPMIQKLKQHRGDCGVRGLVLSPSRELALQTFKFSVDMAKFTTLRIVSIVGGDGIESQFEMLSNAPDILVATPGRLMHHLREITTFKLSHVNYLVFDEADRLFEMGFAEQLNEIVKGCPIERQTLLFSATMPKQIIQFARAGLRDPQLIRLESESQLSEELRVGFFLLRSNEKLAALMYLVRLIIPDDQMTIIFTATKHHSELIHGIFQKINIKSTLIYGSMDQDARTMNLRSFRNGEAKYLIVTDVAARGIDIPMLHNVINFHFPPNPKLFIHRCGRAARQGRVGYAFSLVEPEELAYMMDTHFFLGHKVSSGYETAASSAAAIENGEDEESAAVVVSSSSSSSSADVAAASSKGPYTMAEMTPSMVHTGLLMQDSIDTEAEFVKKTIEEDITLTNMYRVCENAMKQYHKTRTEATREGVKAAKALVKGTGNAAIQTIHPLIAGCDSTRCHSGVVEKAAYVRALQCFRPAQTVLESGIGTGSSSNKAQHKAAVAKRKLMGGININATGLYDGVNGGAVKDSSMVSGSQVMSSLRKVFAASLDRNRSNNAKNNTIVLRNTQDHLDSMLKDDDDEDDDEYVSANSNSKGSSASADSTAKPSNNSKPSKALLAVVEEEPAAPAPILMSSIHGTKVRLSAAEKRKMKKGKTSIDADSSSSNLTTGSKRAHADVSEGGVLSKVTQGASSYKDPRFYLSYGTENERESFAEKSLQPQSQVRSSESNAVAMLEASLLDVIPEEVAELNKRRKIMRWDAKKRKFVKQTLEEMADSKSTDGAKRVRTESGVLVKSSKFKQGEMYAKWKKKTHKDISLPNGVQSSGGNDNDDGGSSGGGKKQDYRAGHKSGSSRGSANRSNFGKNNQQFGDGEGGGGSQGPKGRGKGKGPAASPGGFKQRKTNYTSPSAGLNFRANANVKDEIRSKAQIRKNKAESKDKTLKNMSKEKRKHVVGKMKQAASAKGMSKKALLSSQRGGKKRSIAIVR